MRAINRKNNPTGLISVDSSVLSIRVNKGARPADPKTFAVERFAAGKAGLLGSLRVACLAMAGQTAQYIELGTVAQIDKRPKPLSELASDASVRFRVIFYEAHNSRIVGAAENVHPLDEDDSSHSLVSIQPGKLDGPLWKLELSDANSENHPVVHVEEQLFASAKAAAANYEFVSFVLPEVFRQIAARVAREYEQIDVEGSWMGKWIEFFGVMNPTDLTDLAEDERVGDWVEACVEQFCQRGTMAAALSRVLADAGGEK